MCSVSALVVSTIMSAAISAGSSIHSANMQSKAARAQARMAEQQQKYVAMEQDYALKRADWDARKASKKQRQQQGEMRSLLAVNGVDLSGGSAFDLLVDAAKQGQREQQDIRHEGAMKAWSLNSKKDQLGFNAWSARQRASNAQMQLGFSLAQTGASTASSLSGKLM